jgi:uncharacterized protein DUF2314
VALRFVVVFMSVSWLVAGCNNAATPTNLPPNPKLSPNAPRDQPVDAMGESEAEEYRTAIAPYVEKGRKTYPEAKRRYLAGLPAGHNFFAVTKLRDGSGTFEQVFVAVASIKDDRITGRIASDIIGVKAFKNGDPYSFAESELVDWLITHPDGSEEGNVVGNFLDEWQKKRPRK